MAHYTATIHWERNSTPFTDNKYSRVHHWRFDGGAEITASSSPQVVPPPLSDESAVDPEEAYVASLSSCHMLWFLHIAAKRGHVVDRYEDEAEGTMGKDKREKLSMKRVTLRPRVSYAENPPNKDEEMKMHHAAHEECFIANSVRTEIVVEV